MSCRNFVQFGPPTLSVRSIRAHYTPVEHPPSTKSMQEAGSYAEREKFTHFAIMFHI